jgi:N12 class adenine-specific DNA methylase
MPKMAPNDFYFQLGQPLDLGTPKQRFEKNKEAIQLAKELSSTGRNAMPEELELLSKYVGWGDSRLASLVHELSDLLTEDELRSVRGSTLNAHYTALPVIGAMWEAALQLGFGERPFRALDPSAGIGHFKSMTPESLREKVDWTEIELDGLTATILKALHPNSRVFNMGFEAANLPDGMFDLAISNVPFGDYGVFSKKLPKYLTNPIHDFFFANTWSLLRPGGVLMYITSRFTLDKKDDRVRKWLARRFDLLAAVRLPETAFEENAGTKVVTDILIMQKRIEETEEVPLWVNTGVFKPDYRAATVNQYYLEHPDMIIGVPSMDGRMYQSDGYTVLPAGMDLPAELSRIFKRVLTRLEPVASPKNEEAIPVHFSDDTVISSRTPAMPVVASKLMEIHDAAKKLIRAETRGDRSNVTVLKENLNRLYDQFVDLYGPINRPQNLRHLNLNGSAEVHFLKSLEKYHTESDTAKKSDIFFKTVVRSVVKSEKLSTSDALLVCLDQMGKVDIPFIASITKTSPDQVIEELRGSIFLEPQSLKWQTSEQYLSGNVRVKLHEAKAAASFDSRFQENVMALESVIPLTIEAGHIRAPLGAGWIPADVIGDFIKHLLKAGEYHVTYIPALATWEIESENTAYIARNLLSAKWGTSRMNTMSLLDAGLNSRDVVVYNGFGKDRTVNTKETVAAQQKLLEIKEEFEKWLWSDAERSKRLVEIYNEEFNSVRNVRYDGSHLTTPGLNQSIRLRSNQKDAAWRIIQNPATLIGHEVGMGKTLTAIVAAMESKRLGFTKKAMLVVPNHTLSNWQIVMQTAYPGANILLPDPSDLAKGKRSEFMSRIATNHWDMILVPFSSFKLLPVSSETLKDFYLEQIDELEEHLLDLKGDKNSKRAVKEIEKALKRFQVKLDTLSSFDKDDEETITWEELGVDMLIVDEMHGFKNLYYSTKMARIAGLSNSDSQRAFDMFVKFRWIIQHGGKVVGMTGTPVTNTIAEMFTMQRFFQLDTLKKLGLAQFDAWARQFALAEPGLEMTPDGSGFRMNTRFRKFVNVPELMQLWLQVADMRRIDPAEIQRPDLFKSKPVKVLSIAGLSLEDYVMKLAERAEKVRSGIVRPEQDNMLCITSDGRKAALDLSLVVPAPAGTPMPKIDDLAEAVAEVWRLTDSTNGVQLIFCDLGVPKSSG